TRSRSQLLRPPVTARITALFAGVPDGPLTLGLLRLLGVRGVAITPPSRWRGRPAWRGGRPPRRSTWRPCRRRRASRPPPSPARARRHARQLGGRHPL